MFLSTDALNLTDTGSFTKTYSVHTGTDIFAVFKATVLTTIQGLSYSVTRQKAPIYVMGSADPVSIARSKRGIAGSMIMTTFDRHCLGDFMATSDFAAKAESYENTPVNPYQGGPVAEDPTPVSMGDYLNTSNSQTTDLNDIKGARSLGINDVGWTTAPPMYPDQILPFDVSLVAANEYGNGSSMRVLGVEILNEGAGISIDDTSNEVQMTYISRLITPWVQTEVMA